MKKPRAIDRKWRELGHVCPECRNNPHGRMHGYLIICGSGIRPQDRPSHNEHLPQPQASHPHVDIAELASSVFLRLHHSQGGHTIQPIRLRLWDRIDWI